MRTQRFLRVILDKRLRWEENLRARATLYVCRGAIGSSWGLSPRGVYWLGKMVVEPILFYGAVVWWRVLDTAANRTRFERVLRMVALMLTGAMRSTPTKALFAMLCWLPVDLMARRLALRTALRLSAIGAWNSRAWGHAAILGTWDTSPGLLDYCTPRPYFDRGFSVSILGESSSPPGTLCVYTDGSRVGNRVGGGVYIGEYGIRMSFRLPNGCNVFQAEVSAIVRAANWLRYHRISGRMIRIYTDSRAAIRSLSGVFSSSILVREGRASLDAMATLSDIGLVWVKGHGMVEGNLIADSLAREGVWLDDSHVDEFCGLPLSLCYDRVDTSLMRTAQTRWNAEPACGTARVTWPRLDWSRTLQLLSLSRGRVRDLVAVVTGHCFFGVHASRMGLPYNDFCRSCGDEEEEETITHLLCHCPALEEYRLSFMGARRLDALSEISVVRLKDIISFIGASGWFPRAAL